MKDEIEFAGRVSLESDTTLSGNRKNSTAKKVGTHGVVVDKAEGEENRIVSEIGSYFFHF